MLKLTRLSFVAVLMSVMTFSAGAADLMQAETNGASWVASPYRAAGVKWEIPKIAGRDFTLLLVDDVWRNKKGLQDEAFIKESGAEVLLPLVQDHAESLRTIVLKEVEIYQEAGAGNSARQAVISIEPKEKDTLLLDPEYIADGKAETAGVITADPQPLKQRYLPAEASVHIRLPTNAPVSRIVIRHGAGTAARLAKVSFFAVNHDEAVRLEPGELKNADGVLTAVFTNAPAAEGLRLDCVSDRLVYRIGAIPASLEERMQAYPFYVELNMRPDGSMLGLTEENFDQAAFSAFRKKYEKTFMGFRYAEWDGTFLRAYIAGSLSGYVTPDADKAGMTQNLHAMWDYHKNLFKKVFGLSGQQNYAHYGMERGGTIAGLELSGESPDWPWRNNLLFVRGAARQYNAPWLIYLAYYAQNASASSKPYAADGSFYGLDYGIPPSLGLRLFYLSYYLGNSFLDFECQPWGQIKEEADGTCVLTKNGEAIKDIFEWTRSEKGTRGSCYTPILLLMKYDHGHDIWKRCPSHGWTTWYGLFPFDDGDFMAEHMLRAIDPYYGVAISTNPQYSGNLHNSALGDIFDLYMANPPSGAVRLAQLEKYPVTILMDDIAFTAELVGNLKAYVAKGGTLLINSGQASAFKADPSFLGMSLLPSFVEADGLKVQRGSLSKGAQVLLASTNAIPLLIKNTYGKGTVLFTTPVFMLQTKDKTIASPLIARVLEKIQDEVLPVKVEGDIHFLFNIMPDGVWKVILINNRGIVKLPNTSTEIHDPAFTSEVKITAPAGVAAKEIRTGAEITTSERDGKTVFTLNVPPAGIRVVDLKNVTIKIPADDLLGEWKFEEGEGNTARDSSGNRRDIKLTEVDYAKTKSGFCLNYSKPKSSAYLSFPLEYPLKEGTFEIWAAPELTGNAERMGGKNRGDIFNTERGIILSLVDSRWVLRIFDRNSQWLALNGPKAENKKWTHLAVTWSGFLCHGYVDGQEIKGPTGPLKFCTAIGNDYRGYVNLFLGSQNPRYSTSSFRGLLDNFRVYNRALGSDEVKSHYENELKTTFLNQ